MKLQEFLSDTSRKAREKFARKADVSMPTLDAALRGEALSLRCARSISSATRGAVPVVSLLGLNDGELRAVSR
jgi:hypothetical protein